MGSWPIDGTSLTDEVVDRAIKSKNYILGDGYQTTDLLWEAIGDFRKVASEKIGEQFYRVVEEHKFSEEIKDDLFKILNNF